MSEASVAGQIAEIACSATSLRVFREEVLGVLQHHIDFDGALFGALDPVIALGQDAWLVRVDRRAVEAAREALASRHVAELSPLWSAAMSAGGAMVETAVFCRRYFTEVLQPTDLCHTMWADLQRRGERVAVIYFARSGRPFGDRELGLLRSLRPVLALAERCVGTAPGTARREPPIAGLSPREREVLDLVGLGYTNAEIALGLGSSANTVRNQLHRIFQKVGVTTRAELVGLVAGGGR